MLVPIVEPRMEQSSVNFSVFGSSPEEICSLVQITMMTSQREIFRRIFSSVLARSDMFDVKWQRLLFLPQHAILATIVRASPNQLSEPGIHQAALERMRRALA